jgi:hypothetical protein
VEFGDPERRAVPAILVRVASTPRDDDLRLLDLENFYRHVLDGAPEDDEAFALHVEAAVDSWFGVLAVDDG